MEKSAKPRTQTATSVPGLLSLMQSEWDALMLEIHTLKEHLQATRQELSQALYQHEASCRVVCRLLKERDEAREQLAELRGLVTKGVVGSTALKEHPEQKDEELKEAMDQGITKALAESFNALSDSLCEARKARKLPADLAEAKNIAGYKEISTISLHPGSETTKAGLSCLDLRRRDEELVLTGGKDGLANLYSLASKKVLATFNHKKKITMASFLPGTRLAAIICSADGTAGYLSPHNRAACGTLMRRRSTRQA